MKIVATGAFGIERNRRSVKPSPAVFRSWEPGEGLEDCAADGIVPMLSLVAICVAESSPVGLGTLGGAETGSGLGLTLGNGLDNGLLLMRFESANMGTPLGDEAGTVLPFFCAFPFGWFMENPKIQPSELW